MNYLVAVMEGELYPIRYYKTHYQADKYIKKLTQNRPDMEWLYTRKKIKGLKKYLYLWWFPIKIN